MTITDRDMRDFWVEPSVADPRRLAISHGGIDVCEIGPFADADALKKAMDDLGKVFDVVKDLKTRQHEEIKALGHLNRYHSAMLERATAEKQARTPVE